MLYLLCLAVLFFFFFFFSSRRRHTRSKRDWSSDVCSSDLIDLNNSEGFVQPKPSGRICKGTPVQPPFSLRCTELTRYSKGPGVQLKVRVNSVQRRLNGG